MVAGDKPLMVSSGLLSWQIETTFGTSPAAGAWNPFGIRQGELRSLGPVNTWNRQRGWGGGREALSLDLLGQDYGGSPAVFKVSDPRVPAFAWGQEPNLPVALGGGYNRHTVQPTLRHPGPSMAVQYHNEDADANAVRTTYQGLVMTEVELSGEEGGETFFAPTFIGQSETTAIGKNSITDPTGGAYKHFHGSLTFFGNLQQRILSWRFRKISKATRARYWNSTNPKLATEYPLEDVDYVLECRLAADAQVFAGFGNRDWQGLARNGDIGKATIQVIRTANQDEFGLTLGSGNDALGVLNAHRVSAAEGGKVQWDLALACRVSTYNWVDTNAARYFPS